MPQYSPLLSSKDLKRFSNMKSSLFLYIFFTAVLCLAYIFVSRPEQMVQELTKVVEMTPSASIENLSVEPKKEPAAVQKFTEKKVEKMAYRGELSSMDGIGYNFENIDLSPLPKFHEIENFPDCNLSFDKLKPKTSPEKLLKGFHDCVDPIFENQLNKLNATDFSYKICSAIEKCDHISELQNVAIEEFKNDHETKWGILPNCKEENMMVTLGIGHDVKAEVLLHRTLPNTKFYGADPIIEPNLQLYSTFGKFFPFALGNQAGMNRFRVLPNQNQKTRKYTYQDVTTIELTYFLKDIANLTQIDFLWIDIEGGELTFLNFLNKGKQLDQAGITICQFNIELHPVFFDKGYEAVYNFMNKVLGENRYIFLKPMETGKGVYRLFFINVEDQKCVRKFLQ